VAVNIVGLTVDIADAIHIVADAVVFKEIAKVTVITTLVHGKI
jgi:hypothetical protein